MTVNKNHTRQQAFRFKRWSNKSFALFNAIGRVVNIGCLSTIIQKMVTVKSVIFQGYQTRSGAHDNLQEEEEEKALIFYELLSTAGLIAITPVSSCTTPCEHFESDFSIGYCNNVIIKAFLGPFFIVKNYTHIPVIGKSWIFVPFINKLFQ